MCVCLYMYVCKYNIYIYNVCNQTYGIIWYRCYGDPFHTFLGAIPVVSGYMTVVREVISCCIQTYWEYINNPNCTTNGNLKSPYILCYIGIYLLSIILGYIILGYLKHMYTGLIYILFDDVTILKKLVTPPVDAPLRSQKTHRISVQGTQHLEVLHVGKGAIALGTKEYGKSDENLMKI